MRHAMCKMQLDFSQLQLDVLQAYVDASLERSRSDTYSVTASPRSPRVVNVNQAHECNPSHLFLD
ncbi:BQ5605_C023g09603 [Microbotryum silenes-dioicae]|uniref:BQ5605_C023g09603 protein n=1 Tax=Microbotryum silenes-dioicae TaxID=796604 RepID=A0A2X0ML54_9BASI|nr:BQ5605_C023g09603 [Microbotryum silenes-dioicae]